MKSKNRFKIKQSLGKGRLGEVFHAEDALLKRDVILREFYVPQSIERYRRSFEKEFLSLMEDLSAIENASLLPVLDAGIVGDTAYMVGAFANGDTLKSLLGRKEFEITDVYLMAKQLLEGLGQLTQHGFYHYHFRLSSVLVQKKANGGKHFLLMDMGYSKLLPLVCGHEAEKTMIAPAFAAPELCEGKPMGEITSLFMIGQLCYAMLADCHPLSGLTLSTAYAKHRVGELPYISGYRENIPKEFKNWVYKLMSPDWRDRPQSLAEAHKLMPCESLLLEDEVSRIQPLPISLALEA